ncbi:MAG: hypothetical protein ACX930_12730 [Erythrobacter sp.]
MGAIVGIELKDERLLVLQSVLTADRPLPLSKADKLRLAAGS